MNKKTYRKPVLSTRVVTLGVYGNYNDGPDGKDGGGASLPHPFKPITDRRFTME